ncbi:MAG: nuclear transport factor 2 family protein [Vicinamibacteria bacterium]|nr:nuclear transport factor 2 family protein [Vicinamibacteria bacterium]
MAPEEEARTATLKFYQALDDLLLSKGTQAMSQAWHHDEFVTTVHPFGHWSRGWDEVWATWEEIAALFSFYRGHAVRQDGIGAIHDLRIAVLGEAAYTIGIYKSRLYMPEGEVLLSVNCTNVLQKRAGVWKIVHHHPDQAPADYQAALTRMVEKAQA